MEKLKNCSMNIAIKEVEGVDRVLSFVGSTDVKDREGEILEKDGWKLTNYKKNPVFLLAHDYRSLPIGKSVRTEMTDKGLEFDIEFADRETYPLADTVYRLYKGGFLNAVSVGYNPNRDKIDVIDGVPHFKENELYELSAASVPANPQALMQRMFEAEQKGVVNRQEIMELSLAAKSFFSGMKNATPPKVVVNTVPMTLDPHIPETKSGRVLSKANEKLLRDAIEAVGKATETISKVLDKVATPEPVPEEPKTVKYPNVGLYNDLLSGKAGSKSGNAELIDPTLIKQAEGLNKKEN